MRLAECDRPLLGWLERLAPHGLGNREPLFRADGLTVLACGRVGQDKHLRLQVRDATGVAEAIAFGLGERCAEVKQAKVCSLLFEPVRNEWRGETRVQLKVKDVAL